MLLVTLAGCAAQAPKPEWYERATAKPYADVLAELEVAITEQNFRITGHNHIGSVIRSRDNIAFPDYDAIQFCNLTLAKEMLEMSPAAVNYMPCNVTVRAQDGRTVVATHLLPVDTGNPKLDAFFLRMNDKLKRIVEFAVEQ
jgi:uncharacterized protein (DUF302 family)